MLAEPTWSLAVHGGAARDDDLGERDEPEARATLARVLEAGAALLAAGGTSVDAVEDAVRRLEDSPLFNAGKGSVFNARGEHELEASIMDGRTLRAGAVASLRGIRNPVTLARLIMERSAHVFLQGEGALAFAKSQGVELVDEAYFWTERRWRTLEKVRAQSVPGAAERSELSTVGAVALDRDGNLAAATSTGGITNKLPGRVGDSPIIGAGTYASNASCAVSCTGHGEYFIRAAAARDLCALIEYGGNDARTAAETVVWRRVAALGGEGGVIVVARTGEVAFAFNTARMYRGCVTAVRSPWVAVRKDAE